MAAHPTLFPGGQLPPTPQNRRQAEVARVFVQALGRAIWKEAFRQGALAGARLVAEGATVEQVAGLLADPAAEKHFPAPPELPDLTEQELWGLLEHARGEAWLELERRSSK